MEFIDLRQVGENAGQLFGVKHGPHLLEKHLVQDLQRAQVGHLGGEELWRGQADVSGFCRASLVPPPPTTPTVYDRLPVHFPLAERGQKLRGDGVLPVLALARLLLQRRGVRQQRQGRVHAPGETGRPFRSTPLPDKSRPESFSLSGTTSSIYIWSVCRTGETSLRGGWRRHSPASRPRGVWGCRVL